MSKANSTTTGARGTPGPGHRKLHPIDSRTEDAARRRSRGTLRHSYGRLNEAVKRNAERFPPDFMFQLEPEEAAEIHCLRSQVAILNKSARGQHRKYLPYAFTEHGVAMLSSVLRSPRAIQVNISIVRTFIRLGHLLAAHQEIAAKLQDLEWRQHEQGQQIQAVFQTIDHLMQPAEKEVERRRIGFPLLRASLGVAGA